MTTELTTLQRPLQPAELQTIQQQAKILEYAGKGTKILPKGIENRAQIASILLKARELGLPTMYALSNIAMIEGKPTLSAHAIGYLIKRHFGSRAWRITKYTREAVVVHFTRDDQELDVEWTVEDAKTAQLIGKDNWRHYPRQMLAWRAIAEGGRLMFPEVLAGFYLPDELGVELEEVADPEEAELQPWITERAESQEALPDV